MLRETGNNISVCTYNGYLEVDRQLHLEEICGRVTVTETVVNVLECDVNLKDRGIGPVEHVGGFQNFFPKKCEFFEFQQKLTTIWVDVQKSVMLVRWEFWATYASPTRRVLS